jgi:hypothetical protein
MKEELKMIKKNKGNTRKRKRKSLRKKYKSYGNNHGKYFKLFKKSIQKNPFEITSFYCKKLKMNR